MDRQGVRRDDVALLRERTQIDRSSLTQEQIDHSTASLADEMIMLAGLGIESGSLVIQKEGADLALVDEAVKVAIDGGETDPRQFLANPLVDLMGERVSVIALESFEHLLQLARRTSASGSPHRLTSTSRQPGGLDRTVSESDYQIDAFLSSDAPGDTAWMYETSSSRAHFTGLVASSRVPRYERGDDLVGEHVPRHDKDVTILPCWCPELEMRWQGATLARISSAVFVHLNACGRSYRRRASVAVGYAQRAGQNDRPRYSRRRMGALLSPPKDLPVSSRAMLWVATCRRICEDLGYKTWTDHFPHPCQLDARSAASAEVNLGAHCSTIQLGMTPS
jgi:hypothetical protein